MKLKSANFSSVSHIFFADRKNYRPYNERTQLKGIVMNEKQNENLDNTSKLSKVKKIVTNRKVVYGATIAATAVVSALLARSELFASKLDLDDVVDTVADVVTN